MPVEFEAVDPRNRRVICTHDVWRNHIVWRRSWMASPEWIELIKKTIREPLGYIYLDANFPLRHVYYHLIKSRGRYLKVVVEFKDEKSDGRVISAYPVDNAKDGERILWP